MPATLFLLSWRSATLNPCRTFGSRSDGDGLSQIRTRHPSGSRPWGCFSRKQPFSPWLGRVPENPEYPGLSMWSRTLRSAAQVYGSPSLTAPTLGRLRTEADPSNLSLPDSSGDETTAKSSPVVISQPQSEFAASAHHLGRSYQGLIHVERHWVTHNVVTRLGPFVRHGFDRHNPVAAGPLAQIGVVSEKGSAHETEKTVS